MPSRTVTLKGKAATAWLKRNPYSFLDDDDSAKEPELVINTLQEAKQAAFTGAVRGLASQEWKQCSNVDGICSLNTGTPGFHCALGWLIPWENQQVFIGYDSDDVIAKGILHPALVAWSDKHSTFAVAWGRFLDELQTAHDYPDSSDKIRSEFLKLRLEHNLVWPKDVE